MRIFNLSPMKFMKFNLKICTSTVNESNVDLLSKQNKSYYSSITNHFPEYVNIYVLLFLLLFLSYVINNDLTLFGMQT